MTHPTRNISELSNILSTHDTNEAYLHSWLLARGFRFSTSCVIDRTKIEEAIRLLTRANVLDQSHFRKPYLTWDDDYFISISRTNHSIRLLSKDPISAKPIIDKIARFCIDNDNLSLYYYHISNGSVASNLISIDRTRFPVTYPELYPDIDINILAREYSRSKDSILILYGPPGVGKTTFIKYLMVGRQLGYSDVIYVKDMEVMVRSNFWSQVAEDEHDLMIFDDLDFALGPRKKHEESSIISNLLSYSDGLFVTKSKIIITTNQTIDEIDSALIRPGRCFDFLVLNPLSVDYARQVWVEVLGVDASHLDPHIEGLKTVTQADLMSLYEDVKCATTYRPYLKKGREKTSIRQRIAEVGISMDTNTSTGFGR